MRFSSCSKMESQNGNKHGLFIVWARTKACAPQQQKSQGWEQQRGHRHPGKMLNHDAASLQKLNGQLLAVTPGSERKQHPPVSSLCQESCQAGKKWCFTLDPRLTQRLAKFKWVKARARAWPCCFTAGTFCSRAWASARWAMSCPMASGPQHTLGMLWFNSMGSQKRVWQDVCSPKSQTSCRRKTKKVCCLTI